MCGRFTLRSSPRAIATEFDLFDVPDLRPRYNVAPTQQIPIVRMASGGGDRELAMVRWGLIPFWASDQAIGNRMINARADTVATKPSFRHPFKLRRCLVVADGFFEWKKEGQVKQPYYFQRRDEGPFAFAGLWETWAKGGSPIESCTIITTEPNELTRTVHDRMPVILPKEAYGAWLDPAAGPESLSALLKPFPAEDMVVRPVSRRVSSPANDDAGCVGPAE
jgi:putative SOS response-associated peptidase YedK